MALEDWVCKRSDGKIDFKLEKEIRWSKSHKRPYFFNAKAEQSVWDRPEDVQESDITSLKGAELLTDPPKPEGQVRASHILVKWAGSRRPSSWKDQTITRSSDQALQQLETYQDQLTPLKDDPAALAAKFAEIASTESDCSSHSSGGDLGFFGRQQMQKPFEDATYSLQIGQISEITQTDSGMHLILRTCRILARLLVRTLFAPERRPMPLPRDVMSFISEYPGLEDSGRKDNLLFYQNQLRCQPDGLLIEEIHSQWRGRFNLLEGKHGFIQWLFPIQEHGMNMSSQPLQAGELEIMRSDANVRRRLIKSYRLMLEFYGMSLMDESTGRLQRLANFDQRYDNLESSSHNYLRISRILKCLGEMDFKQYPAAFVLFVLAEQSEHSRLTGNYLENSMDRWWANCNRDNVEREQVCKLIAQVRKREDREAFTMKDCTTWLETRQNSSIGS